MKRVIATLFACATLTAALLAQMPKYGVSVVTEDKNTDFAKLTHYSWTQAQPSMDKEIDAKITAAVDHELQNLGMTKGDPSFAQVLVAYSSLTRTDVNHKGKAEGSVGGRPEQQVGTLGVALMDPATRKRLLVLRIDKPITINVNDATAAQTVIDDAVAQLFLKYPTRKKK